MGRLTLTMGVGVIIGALVLLGTVAAGNKQRKWLFGLGGTAWGFALAWLILSDCIRPGFGPLQLSGAAFPVFFVGVIAWPVGAAWGQPRWFWRWLAAQLIVLLTLVPAFFLGVMGALCNMT